MNIMSPIQIRGLELKNRIVMPPMCQFCVEKKDGKATDWHFVHYVSRAAGGTGLILVEMCNVEPRGRITDFCLGLWEDEQIEPLRRIVDACRPYGTKMGIQIGHAGRKAKDAKEPVSCSPIAFSEDFRTPRELSTEEVYEMIESWGRAISRAVSAGFDTIELHGAHGYLIHQFQAPRTNRRSDEFGKDPALFGKLLVQKARSLMPEEMPLIFRLSAIEYVEEGYGLDYAVELCRQYRDAGVDLFHVSSGGESPLVGSFGRITSGPGYQIPFARAIREALEVPVIAVGKLDEPALANAVLTNQDADLVAVGRGMLRNPNWVWEACVKLGIPASPTKQIEAGFPKLK